MEQWVVRVEHQLYVLQYTKAKPESPLVAALCYLTDHPILAVGASKVPRPFLLLSFAFNVLSNPVSVEARENLPWNSTPFSLVALQLYPTGRALLQNHLIYVLGCLKGSTPSKIP